MFLTGIQAIRLQPSNDDDVLAGVSKLFDSQEEIPIEINDDGGHKEFDAFAQARGVQNKIDLSNTEEVFGEFQHADETRISIPNWDHLQKETQPQHDVASWSWLERLTDRFCPMQTVFNVEDYTPIFTDDPVFPKGATGIYRQNIDHRPCPITVRCCARRAVAIIFWVFVGIWVLIFVAVGSQVGGYFQNYERAGWRNLKSKFRAYLGPARAWASEKEV